MQGDGDYEFVKDVIFDDYLRKRIAKVCSNLLLLRIFLPVKHHMETKVEER